MKPKALAWIPVLFFLLMVFLPPPPGLSPQGWNAIVIFLVIATLWVTEVIPIAVAAIFAVILQPILFVSTPMEALSAFGSSAVFLILAGFMLGIGLMRTGLDRRIAYMAIRASDNPKVTLFGVMAVTAILSMIISNTATVLLMLPIIITLCEKSKLSRKAFLLAVAYAANVGGVGLLVGTPPNIIAAEALGWGFFEWMLVGLPFAIITIPMVYLSLLVMYKPHKRKSSVVLGLKDPGPLSRKEKTCATIIIITMALWITSPLHGISAAMVGLFGGFLMLVFVYDWGFFQSNTSWSVIFLMGGAISLANALTATGASSWMAQNFLLITGLTDPVMIAFGLALLAVGLTQFIQNTATAGMLVPILMGISAGLGGSPGLVVIPVIATSMTFLLPPGTAPNAIVHGAGVSSREMARAGIVPTILALGVLLVYAYVIV
jgi:sodium-dependent dicarboxylate transporter 2/3/5